MAGLSLESGVRGQFGAVTHVRWQMFVHSLSTTRGRVEVVSRIFIALVFSIAGIGGAIGLAIGAWFFISRGKMAFFALLLWPVFLAWQFVPIMTSSFGGENLDASDLLRFPLSYRFYLLLRLIYGSLEPAAVLPGLWLLGITVGVGIAAPWLLVWAAVVFFAFALMNVLLSRMIFAWVDRWLARRRTREIVGLVFFLVMMSFQFIGPVVQRFGEHAGPQVIARVQQLSHVGELLPPGLAADAIASAANGSAGASVLAFALLCIYVVVFFWLLHLRMRAQYRGENLSEAVARATSRQQAQVRPGWNVFGLPGPIAAIFEKEFHYLLRSGPMIFNLVMPAFMLLIFRIGGPSGQGKAESFLARTPNIAFPLGAAYALMILANIIYNSLGADGGGIQMLFAAPVRFRQVMMAKNLAHFAVYAMEMVLVWVAVRLLYQPPAVDVTIVTLAAVCFALPIDFATGNIASVYSPKKMELGKFNRQRGSRTTVLASLGVHLGLFGVAALIVALCRHFSSLWLAAPIFLILAAAGIAMYFATLQRVDVAAMRRREILVTEITKN